VKPPTCLLLFAGFSLVAAIGVHADSSVDVKLQSCNRMPVNTVVCSFLFGSSATATMSITGGQYSQVIDAAGNAWHATNVRVGDNSGMAAGFDVMPGLWQHAEVTFEGVDAAVEIFQSLTLRFNDGYWQTNDVPVKNE
jgi:hypothetical protein